MDNIIKILGIVFIVFGILYFTRPEIMERMIEFFKQGKRIYLAGLLRFALAIIFLIGARECHRFWIIFTLGILFLIGGVLIFVLGPEKIRRIFDWYQSQSLLFFRIIAVVPMVLGVVIIFSA